MHTDPDINYLTKENPFFEIGIESVLGIELQVFKNRPKILVRLSNYQKITIKISI